MKHFILVKTFSDDKNHEIKAGINIPNSSIRIITQSIMLIFHTFSCKAMQATLKMPLVSIKEIKDKGKERKFYQSKCVTVIFYHCYWVCTTFQ